MSSVGPNTAAHSLHALFEQVRTSEAQYLGMAWGDALQCEYGSAEFGARHAEVGELLANVVDDLKSLPATTRERNWRYVAPWWQAITQPEVGWSTNPWSNVAVIDQNCLDALANIGDLVAMTFPGTPAAPLAGDLEQFKSQCESLVAFLNSEEADDIPRAVREQLARQLEHVVWLIGLVDVYGSAHVVRVADQAVGTAWRVSETAVRATQDTNRARKWRMWAASLLVGVASLTMGLNEAATAIGAADQVVKEISSVAHHIEDFGSAEN